MKEGLEKIIYTMILEKYSWIEDFEVKVYTFRFGNSKKIAYQDYGVIYYVHPDVEDSFTVNDEFIKVEELTETLFKMIGPEHYQRFKGVEFTTKDK